MAQFLRPDSNVTQTSFTNGFAQIDEEVASDADFAYGANNTAAVLEVHVSNPPATPDAAGTSTVRYRIARTNAGTLSGTGNAVTVTPGVYQGATLIQAGTAQTATGTWTTYTFTFTHGSITDWTNIRLRFTTSASGGTAANRRGGAISWAEIEAPDAAVLRNLTLPSDVGSFTSTAQAAALEVGRVVVGAAGAFTQSGQAAATVISRTLPADAAAFAVAGQDALLEWPKTLAAEAGAFLLVAPEIAFLHTHTLVAEPTSYQLEGDTIKLKFNKRKRGEKGNISNSGYPTWISYRRRQTLIG